MHYVHLCESSNGLNLAQSSSVLSPEGKDQVGDEREQSAHHQKVPRSNTISPNDSKCEDADGKSRKAMNQTKRRITECIDGLD
uniref:Uncharacterized protein n=1 Tax=Solanum tuberosum TaxID=4113 RepID=M1DPA4_SOLTU